MSKAVLVMDMPSGCIKCPLYDYVPTRCFATDKFQNNTSEDFKPNWCPLRELPEYKEENHTLVKRNHTTRMHFKDKRKALECSTLLDHISLSSVQEIKDTDLRKCWKLFCSHFLWEISSILIT